MSKVLKYMALVAIALCVSFFIILFVFKGTFCDKVAESYIKHRVGIRETDKDYEKGLILARRECISYSSWDVFEAYTIRPR